MKHFKITLFQAITLALLLAIIGMGAGFFSWSILNSAKGTPATADDLSLDEQEATIRAIDRVIPAVVSIIIYDKENLVTIDFSTGQQQTTNQRQQIGSGTGFIVTADGLILTNRHVVEAADPKTAEYRIILNTGKEYYAQLIGTDPIKDLAILKIFDKDLPYVELGNSDQLQIGTTVVAIGNALGRYQNSATKGIVSGLGRSITASDQTGNAEVLDNVIQTDAEINPGNSGGPLIDLTGKVVGVDSAIDQAGESIGFAIPINDAKITINSVEQKGRVIRPSLGLRYLMLTPTIAQDNKLPRQSGAWVVKGDNGEPAVLPGSAADKAGIEEGDIIFEINAIKIDGKATLLSVVQKYKPGDKIGLKIQRGDKTIIKVVQLDEFK